MMVVELFGHDDPLPVADFGFLTATPATLVAFHTRWLSYLQLESIVGSTVVARQVTDDLTSIDRLIATTTNDNVTQTRAVAARYECLAGWTAQELGDLAAAAAHTSTARTHAELCDDNRLEAFILLRLANIAASTDHGAAHLHATKALTTAQTVHDDHLTAAIHQQLGNIAATQGDRTGFDWHAGIAAQLSADDTTKVDELTAHICPAYIASQTAAGLIVLNDPGTAIEALDPYLSAPVDGQQRDHSIALTRWLYALTAQGDHTTAVDVVDHVIVSYLASPSTQSADLLRQLATPGTKPTAPTDTRSRIARAITHPNR